MYVSPHRHNIQECTCVCDFPLSIERRYWRKVFLCIIDIIPFTKAQLSGCQFYGGICCLMASRVNHIMSRCLVWTDSQDCFTSSDPKSTLHHPRWHVICYINQIIWCDLFHFWLFCVVDKEHCWLQTCCLWYCFSHFGWGSMSLRSSPLQSTCPWWGGSHCPREDSLDNNFQQVEWTSQGRTGVLHQLAQSPLHRRWLSQWGVAPSFQITSWFPQIWTTNLNEWQKGFLGSSLFWSGIIYNRLSVLMVIVKGKLDVERGWVMMHLLTPCTVNVKSSQ